MANGEEGRKFDRDDQLHVVGSVEQLRKVAIELDGEQAMVWFAIGRRERDVGAFPDQIDCDHFSPVWCRAKTGSHLALVGTGQGKRYGTERIDWVEEGRSKGCSQFEYGRTTGRVKAIRGR